MTSSDRILSTPDDRVVLAALFRQALDSTGLSGVQAARALGCAPSAVSQYASGDREVPAAALLWALRTAHPARRPALLGLFGSLLWGEEATGGVVVEDEALDVVEAAAGLTGSITRAMRDGAIEHGEVPALRKAVTAARTQLDELDAGLDEVERQSPQMRMVR